MEKKMHGVSSLRICRIRAGLSQRELGRRVGLTQAMISYIENRKVFPGAVLKRAIVEILGQPETVIFSED